MAKIRIVGDSSGYVEIAAPNAAGNNTLELPSSGTRLTAADSSGNLSVSGILTVSAGSTSIPSISPSGDSNTGIFFPSADTIAFGEGGVESARFDSSGRLGIGTANPSEALHVLRATNGGQFAVDNTGQEYTSINLKNTGTRKGILEWSNTGNILSLAVDGAGSPTGSLHFGTNSLSRMIIDSSGRITKPYQPAFLASGNQGTITVAVGNYLPFNTLNTTFANSNRNSGYNTSTYLYTAPVAGLYQFYVQLYLNPNSVISSLTWWKNGTQLDYGSDAAINIFMNTNSSTTPANIMLNGSVILELSANDTVGIKPRTGNPSSISFYMGHSTFWGYLIG
jgi:hypothetical protein